MLSKLLDKFNIAILNELQRDGRLSFSEAGPPGGALDPGRHRAGAPPEDAGVIAGYGARINPGALGYTITALIEVATPPHRYQQMLEFAQATPAVRECYFVTGESSFVAKVMTASVEQLQELIQQLGFYGSTRTSVVLSQPIIKEIFEVG